MGSRSYADTHKSNNDSLCIVPAYSWMCVFGDLLFSKQSSPGTATATATAVAAAAALPSQQAQADTKPPATPSTPIPSGGPPATPDIKMMPPETPKDEKLFPGLSATADIDKVSLHMQLTSRQETDRSSHLNKRSKQHHVSLSSQFSVHSPKVLCCCF